MIDFSLALYLGLRHPAWSLRPWEALSAGKPSALAEPEGACETAQSLAALIGCERGMLLPSTLHAFWDLFAILSGKGLAVYMDSGVYPVVRWGIERAAVRGLRVQRFPHHDAEALRSMLKRSVCRGLKPAVVVDGFCPGCGRPAPIKGYIESVRAYGGYLIMDDTQALGIFGERSNPNAPFGWGGGGTLRWNGIWGDDIVVVNSLAKGFGVPVAVLAGSSAFVKHFIRRSETRIHCSPPSVAVVRAAEHALIVNEKCGDNLRLRLAQLVQYFRYRLAEAGFYATGELFPVQTLASTHGMEAAALHERLHKLGIKTVLRRGHNVDKPQLSFLITARHTQCNIDRAVDALIQAVESKKLKQQCEVKYEERI